MSRSTTWTPTEVKGLTDRPRLPRLGKIHLGVKKVSQKGNEYPSAVDYFVAPEPVRAVYGEKPRELDIVFPTDDVARIAPTAWKMYSAARGKTCTGDGERAVRMIDDDLLPPGIEPADQSILDRAIVHKDSKNISRREIPCPAKDCSFAKKGLCKPVLNLQFMLPSVSGIGVWALDTGSINSILDVRGGIELVMKLSGGRLAGIPLKLRLEPMEVISPEDQKKKVVFTLKLISPATLGRVLMAGERNLRELLMADNPDTPQVALPEPREVPDPAEPEEDLFPGVITSTPHRVAADAAPIEAAAPRGSARPSEPETLKRDRAAEVSDHSSTAAPAAVDDMALAAEIEELFADLDVAMKERAMYRNAYKTKPAQLRDMLKKTLATKTQGGKK